MSGASLPTFADAHHTEADEIARAAGVDPERGLATSEARARLADQGPNTLQEATRESVLRMVLEAATEPFVVLLAVAGLLAIMVGEVRDGLLILIALLPIVGADVVTEYRGQRALEALREASAPHARVRRDGTVDDLPAADLVVGDVVLLRSGDVVPADLRLARAEGLQLDRSILTGESLPEPATVEPDEPGVAFGQAHAIAHAGTSVVAGRAEGIVVATGARTAMGTIAGGLGGRERRRSPLQLELDRLVRILLVVALGLIAIVSGLGFLRGRSLGENVLAGISAAIAAIPEEPPILLAVILGLGAYRLLRRGVLVRRLNAEETFGAVDLIVTDKTGTITQNRLMVRSLRSPQGPLEESATRREVLLDALRAEEDAWRIADGARPGAFTRGLIASLVAEGVEGGLPADERLLEALPPVDGRPFSITRTSDGDGLREQAIGAPEAVLDLADGLDPASRTAWQGLVDEAAASGERLVLLARRRGQAPWQPTALLGFADPLRPGIPEAVEVVRQAGIQVLVVTGDHPLTAATIAREAGIPADRVVTGVELEAWDEAQLAVELAGLHVVARALPEQKQRLVRTARALGRTVAVTGDGVNDAPALHAADVAVAMGSGTQVAREASDLVLGDDAFTTLTYALREGRRLVANVLAGLVFLISTHVALLGFILIATLAGFDQPLLPVQILWLELFIDLSTSIAFEREAEEPGAMSRPPRRRDVPLLTQGLLARIAVAGSFSAVAALAILVWRDPAAGDEHARWLAYSALVVAQAVRAYSNRSLRAPVWRVPRNGFLLLASLVVILVQATMPYLPALADAFRARPLDALDWGLVALVALGPAILAQLVRRVTGRTWVA